MVKKLLSLFVFLIAFSGYCFDNISLTGPATGPTGDWGIDVFMTTTDGINYTLANHTFVSGELKFRKNSDWNFAYGYATAPGFPSGTGTTPGTNIAVTAGTYNVTFNINTLAYSFTAGVPQFPVISLYGTSTANSDVMLSTTNGIDYLIKSVTFTAGNVKFRRNGNWTQNWGASAFPSGTGVQNGQDIPMPGGTYNITFNFNTGAYGFTPTSVAMIGVGGPSGSWDVDAPMTTTDAIHYTINNVTIAGGMMKIRDNGTWAVQFGAAGAAGSNAFPTGFAVQNGSDMATLAGTYNITFNRTTFEYSFQNALGVSSASKKVFSVAPNPANENWTITSDGAIGKVSVYDVTGKLVKSQASDQNTMTIDASDLSKGIYFAKVISGSANATLKLIRE
ncbi:T9SS type A sorting domain-containing protein [Flavobacterium sp.]|uniref:T9SS type A sorting domain-containing protein n=1 Tax=Flavobacterium sp. TaxID=239 RepID=UPI0012286FF7|nr:T9SS type A sorting domain-containing protein [Flavobacterium sp.]RZJ71237.1 MAG: T9SS type A sorting domain-containing protein [Flavobacterium sp.]